MDLHTLFLAALTCLFFHVNAQDAQCLPDENVTFLLLTSHKMHAVDPLSSVLTFNLSSCIDGCVNDPQCHALNIQNSPKDDFCTYYPNTAALANGTTAVEDLQIFYLEKLCLRGACSRLFAFELVTGKDLIRKPDIVIKKTTRKLCLEACLANSNPPCLSLTFDDALGACSMHSANRFTNPELFQDSNNNLQYFDNNCRDELTGNASYDIVTRNLATHFSDTDYVDVSLADCAKYCQENPDYPCRAFFFGQTVLGRFCGLMHLPVSSVATIPGGIFPVDGVNIYEPQKVSRECPTDAVTFVLMSAQAINEDPATSSPLANPSMCIEHCRKDSRCLALSIDYANAKCSYYTSYKSESIQSDGMVSIYLKTCLDSGVKCPRDWAFERIDGQVLISYDGVVETFTARQCMLACLEERKFQCKSFDYNSVTNRCQMSRLDRGSVNLRQVDQRDLTVPTAQTEISLYENNCYREPSQFCFFDPVKGVDISLHDALVVDGVSNEEDCKRACQQQTRFNCRRYAFVSDSICMLSHYTKATAPTASILRHESQSVFGEIVACYNVSVECGSTMVAHVQSNREYDGVIYAKGKADVGECGQTIRHRFNFDLSLPLNIRTVETCNTYSDEEGEFRNAIILQHNARVVTALDQTFGLQCKYDLHAKEELSNAFNVNLSLSSLPEATKDVIRHRVKMPRITMSILGLDGQEVNQAELGSELIVRIDMEDSEDVFGLSIRNMFAMDGRRKNNMTLVDMQGCPVESLIRNFRQIDPKTLEARMEVFAFPDNNRIIIEAEVQTCRHRCKPVICSNGAESYGRRKRHSTSEDGEEALARDTLRKTVTITSQKFTLPLTSDKSLRISISGSRDGENGLTCFLPHILAILSVCWFVVEMSCISVICFLKRRLNYFKEKIKNSEGFYNGYGAYVTYATVPRKRVTMGVAVPSDDSSNMSSSAC